MCNSDFSAGHFHQPNHYLHSHFAPLAPHSTTSTTSNVYVAEQIPLQQVKLEPVDEVVVTILVDNFVDLLMNDTPVAKRLPQTPDFFYREFLLAEHGFSVMLTVTRNGQKASVMYDAGLSKKTLTHNMDVLEAREDLRAVVLSHGHADHHGGLEGLFDRLGTQGVPLVLHPDIWLERRIVFPTGVIVKMPAPNHNDLTREGVEIIEERGPSLLIDDAILVTGQVPRVTPFEKGFPPQQAFINNSWISDSWVWDDQAIVVNVKDKGLVVISGCSHAGIINVLRHAQNITSVNKIYALVGGLHLTGKMMEPFIDPTLQELMAINPQIIVPGHCTGWKAAHELSHLMPDAYVQTSVGTRLML